MTKITELSLITDCVRDLNLTLIYEISKLVIFVSLLISFNAGVSKSVAYVGHILTRKKELVGHIRRKKWLRGPQ
jgi:hypothetical protein